MAFSLKINDIDWTGELVSKSLRISDNVNGNSTASFKMKGETGGIFYPLQGQKIEIFDFNGVLAYGGQIDEIEEEKVVGSSRIYYDIQCVDWHALADKRLVADAYENTPGDEIIRDLIVKYLEPDGITEGTLNVSQAIEKAVFNYITVSQCLQELADLLGYTWWIESDKRLYFIDRSTYQAPWEVSSGSEIRNVRINRNRKDYRNRQYIRGGQDVTLPMTERPSPKPDGQTRTFTLKFPVAKVPTVRVNGATKTVGIRQVETGKDWYWQKDDKNITQDNGATPLAETDILEVTYQGLFPIIVVADDTAAIGERLFSEGGTGLYENVEEQREIDNRDFALDFAKGRLRKYAKMCTTVTYDTFATDICVGMLQTVNLPEHKINDSFLVSSIEVSDVGNLLNYRVTLISGEELGGWVNFFKKLTNQQTYVIRENEILIKLLTLSDTFSQPTLTESLSWSLHDYPICGPGITCGGGVII